MNDSRPTVVAQSSAVKAKMRFCKYCGNLIENSVCTGCGKRFRSVKKIITFILIGIVIAVIFFTAVYAGYNYYQALRATSQMNFSKAKQHYDALIIADKLFPDEYAYIDACVLIERDIYVEALKKLEDAEDCLMSKTMENYLVSSIYARGLDAYNDELYQTASYYFEAIPEYKNSSDYACLARLHTGNGTALDKRRVGSLIGFADAEDVILSRESYAKDFLDGEWKSEEKYLAVNSSPYLITHNIPTVGEYDTVCLLDGIYYSIDGVSDDTFLLLEFKKLPKTAHFEIRLQSSDSIVIFCYADGKEYTLHRQ